MGSDEVYRDQLQAALRPVKHVIVAHVEGTTDNKI
jgi:hypothetical protein